MSIAGTSMHAGFSLERHQGRASRHTTRWFDYLPGHKADNFHHCRLDNLLADKNTPGDGVGPIGPAVCLEISTSVDSIVRDLGLFLNLGNQHAQILWRDKELQIGLQAKHIICSYVNTHPQVTRAKACKRLSPFDRHIRSWVPTHGPCHPSALRSQLAES